MRQLARAESPVVGLELSHPGQIVARRVLPRLVVSRFGGGLGSSPPGGNGGPRRRPGGGSDVEGTATEIDPPQLR